MPEREGLSTNPGQFAPGGQGVSEPGVFAPNPGPAHLPQPPQLINPPSKQPGRIPIGPGVTRMAAPVATAAAASLAKEKKNRNIPGGLAGLKDEELAKAATSKKFPWAEAAPGDIKKLHEHLSSMRYSHVWSWLHQLHARKSDRHGEALKGHITEHLRQTGSQTVQQMQQYGHYHVPVESPETASLARRVDLSAVDESRRPEVVGLLQSLPWVKGSTLNRRMQGNDERKRKALDVLSPHGVDLGSILAGTGASVRGWTPGESEEALRTPQRLPVVPEEVWGHLEPHEKRAFGKVRQKDLEGIRDFLSSLPPEHELQAGMAGGLAKRGWYETAADVFRFFGEDRNLFTGLLAATSTKNPVRINLIHALEIFDAWDAAGRPTDIQWKTNAKGNPTPTMPFLEQLAKQPGLKGVTFSSRRVPVVKLLAQWRHDPTLAGEKKTPSFARNIMGDPERVTNDVWIAKFARDSGESAEALQEQFGQDYLYHLQTAVIRSAARALGFTPAEGQETLWSLLVAATGFARALHAVGIDVREIPDIVASKLTHEHVRNSVDDYFSLIEQGDPAVASVLERRGLMEPIRQALASIRSGGKPGESARLSGPVIDHFPSGSRPILRAIADRAARHALDFQGSTRPFQGAVADALSEKAVWAMENVGREASSQGMSPREKQRAASLKLKTELMTNRPLGEEALTKTPSALTPGSPTHYAEAMVPSAAMAAQGKPAAAPSPPAPSSHPQYGEAHAHVLGMARRLDQTRSGQRHYEKLGLARPVTAIPKTGGGYIETAMASRGPQEGFAEHAMKVHPELAQWMLNQHVAGRAPRSPMDIRHLTRAGREMMVHPYLSKEIHKAEGYEGLRKVMEEHEDRKHQSPSIRLSNPAEFYQHIRPHAVFPSGRYEGPQELDLGWHPQERMPIPPEPGQSVNLIAPNMSITNLQSMAMSHPNADIRNLAADISRGHIHHGHLKANYEALLDMVRAHGPTPGRQSPSMETEGIIASPRVTDVTEETDEQGRPGYRIKAGVGHEYSETFKMNDANAYEAGYRGTPDPEKMQGRMQPGFWPAYRAGQHDRVRRHLFGVSMPQLHLGKHTSIEQWHNSEIGQTMRRHALRRTFRALGQQGSRSFEADRAMMAGAVASKAMQELFNRQIALQRGERQPDELDQGSSLKQALALVDKGMREYLGDDPAAHHQVMSRLGNFPERSIRHDTVLAGPAGQVRRAIRELNLFGQTEPSLFVSAADEARTGTTLSKAREREMSIVGGGGLEHLRTWGRQLAERLKVPAPGDQGPQNEPNAVSLELRPHNLYPHILAEIGYQREKAGRVPGDVERRLPPVPTPTAPLPEAYGNRETGQQLLDRYRGHWNMPSAPAFLTRFANQWLKMEDALNLPPEMRRLVMERAIDALTGLAPEEANPNKTTPEETAGLIARRANESRPLTGEPTPATQPGEHLDAVNSLLQEANKMIARLHNNERLEQRYLEPYLNEVIPGAVDQHGGDPYRALSEAIWGMAEHTQQQLHQTVRQAIHGTPLEEIADSEEGRDVVNALKTGGRWTDLGSWAGGTPDFQNVPPLHKDMADWYDKKWRKKVDEAYAMVTLSSGMLDTLDRRDQHIFNKVFFQHHAAALRANELQAQAARESREQFVKTLEKEGAGAFVNWMKDLRFGAISLRAERAWEEASSFVSRIWKTDAHGRIPDLKVVNSPTHRSGVAYTGKVPGEVEWVELAQGTDPATAAHELGHVLEAVSPVAAFNARAFDKHRYGSEKPYALIAKWPGNGHRPSEMVRDDRMKGLHPLGKYSPWADAYIGKQYTFSQVGYDGGELISIGLELLYHDPAGFLARDPEYYDFMVATLRGQIWLPPTT